jgi:hypothetical protein
MEEEPMILEQRALQEKPATPKTPTARFTPQQEAESRAIRKSKQFDSGLTPKYTS